MNGVLFGIVGLYLCLLALLNHLIADFYDIDDLGQQDSREAGNANC